MSRDWEQLARAIEAARDAMGLTQVALAEAAGVSESTVQNLESGATRRRTPPSLAKVEQALGWAAGTGLAILTGAAGPADGAPIATEGAAAAGLPLRIVQALGDGPLLDTKILDLEDDSGARMIVVVKGKQNATPEEIERALKAWERTEAQLRGDQSGKQ
ncbi:helix-turn-helix transcriptional regulator [Streptomyces racemochromogenes]|uniref:helix-turn-helix domain-containing protein n=1 Tax=Streptomyces racemochromogenes TaxID=67353 RepID=UPI0031E9AE55